MAFQRSGQRMVEECLELFAEGDLIVAPFDRKQSSLAFAAYRRVGTGNHPAALDFPQTDVMRLRW